MIEKHTIVHVLLDYAYFGEGHQTHFQGDPNEIADKIIQSVEDQMYENGVVFYQP